MVMLVFVMFAYVRALFVSRHKLALEAVALRHQNFIPRFLGVNKNEFRHPVRSLDT
jgi:hypothetical protein